MLRRGCCAKCGEAFQKEEAIVARGKLYHVNHLCCNYCYTRVCYIDDSFILDDNKLACARCFDKLSPKCHKCKRSVVDEYTIYAGLLYHPNCFKCARCHGVLHVEFFEDNDGRPMDRDCLWGQVLMNHIVRDIDNIVPSKY